MFTYITVALAAVSSVVGLAIPRATPPANYGWWLEDYNTYHERYTAIGCTGRQGTDFWEACCHPMLHFETVATARPAYCAAGFPSSSVAPVSSASKTTAAPTATPTQIEDECQEGEPDCVCEEEDDDDTSSSAPAPNPTTSSKPVESPTPTPKPTTTSKPATTTAKATSSPKPTTSVSSGTPSGTGKVFGTDGNAFATYYLQNGAAGACGDKNPDDAKIIALPTAQYGTYWQSAKCGKQVKITRKGTSQSITAIVADECPTCSTDTSIDLSWGAFSALGGTEKEGMFAVEWQYLN